MSITNMIEQSDLLCCYLCIPFTRCKVCKYVSVVIVLYRHECIQNLEIRQSYCIIPHYLMRHMRTVCDCYIVDTSSATITGNSTLYFCEN